MWLKAGAMLEYILLNVVNDLWEKKLMKITINFAPLFVGFILPTYIYQHNRDDNMHDNSVINDRQGSLF